MQGWGHTKEEKKLCGRKGARERKTHVVLNARKRDTARVRIRSHDQGEQTHLEAEKKKGDGGN